MTPLSKGVKGRSTIHCMDITSVSPCGLYVSWFVSPQVMCMRCRSCQVVRLPSGRATAGAGCLCTQQLCRRSQTSCMWCCRVRAGHLPFTFAGDCVSPTLTLCLCGSDDVHRPEPGGADRGWGHISDSGSRGRPGGQCQDSAAARSVTAQHQQQERVSSADR